MRRAAKRDSHEHEIVYALREAGASVVYIDKAGVPDLLVGYRNVNYLMEVKSPLGPCGGASQNGQKLTPEQVVWHRDWYGQVKVVRSVDDAKFVVGAP